MNKHATTSVFAAMTALLTAFGGNAQAQQQPYEEQPNQGDDQVFVQPSPPSDPSVAMPSQPDQTYGAAAADPAWQDPSGETTLIPPNVEGAAYTSGGGYCYVGPHPVDTRVVPGDPWDQTPGQHVRPYAPIDTRLFAFRDGCYYFTGDPRDFGYGGQAYSYYGAHPVLDSYGGGWCFMMGGHTHLWAPWSPYFTVVGPWYYWQGAYDPFFWAYWPYYSFYYRSYYPHYYGGGRFYRGGGYRVAPPIRSVPATAWRGGYGPGRGGYGAARVAPTVRGTTPAPVQPPQMYRGSPSPAPTMMGPSRVGPSQMGPSRPFGAPAAAPRPSFSPPARSFSPAPSHGGGFGVRGGGFRGGHR